MHDSIRRAYEILERLSDDEETQAGAFAPSPDDAEQWQASMPPAPSQPDRVLLFTDALRSEVQRNKREADTNNQALRAAVRSQQKAFDLLPEAIGEAIGKLLAEHRDEIAALRAEVDALRGEVETLNPETVVDMGKAFALRRGAA